MSRQPKQLTYTLIVSLVVLEHADLDNVMISTVLASTITVGIAIQFDLGLIEKFDCGILMQI